jgi:hypothetical protein
MPNENASNLKDFPRSSGEVDTELGHLGDLFLWFERPLASLPGGLTLRLGPITSRGREETKIDGQPHASR